MSISPYTLLNDVPLNGLAGCFHGVIQHSFALQLPQAHEFRETSGWLPRRGRQTRSSASFNALQHRYQQRAYRTLQSLFADHSGTFVFKHPGELAHSAASKDAGSATGSYSWLIRNRHTSLDPQPLALLERDGKPLPTPLQWAAEMGKAESATWKGVVFAQSGRLNWLSEGAESISNDLLLEEVVSPASADMQRTARVLFQLWAHWRSRLFGVSLAHRFFNVFLPYATLTCAGNPDDYHNRRSGVRGASSAERSWLLQPFVSLVREPDSAHCRRTSTFTVLLLPIGEQAATEARRMSLLEIEASVRGAWGLAASRDAANERAFALRGPLRRYYEAVGHDLPGEEALSIRQWTEAALYRITQLRRDRMRNRRRWLVRRTLTDEDVGDRVLTALASARVSAVTVVDRRLYSNEVRAWHEAERKKDKHGTNGAPLFPGALPELIRAVSGRNYLGPVDSYRVDRAFLDRDSYAECAVPAARTLITTTTPCSQRCYEDSGLLQSVSSGYMALGAANAQALIKSSYHEIEARTDPKQFGEVSKEFRRDFHEIYDLDISWEPYKRTYRSILEQFDIMHDYEALRRKLDMLFDTTVAEFTEWQHTRLWFVTWLLVVVTIVLVVRG